MAGLGPAIPDRHSRESGNPVIAAFRYLWPQWLLDGPVKPWSWQMSSISQWDEEDELFRA